MGIFSRFARHAESAPSAGGVSAKKLPAESGPERKIFFLGEPLKETKANYRPGEGTSPTSGGDAVNFTVGAARLNANVAAALGSNARVSLHLVGAFGDSARSQNVLAPVYKAGVDCSHLVTIPNGETAEYKIHQIINDEGEPDRDFTYKNRENSAFRQWFTKEQGAARDAALDAMGPESVFGLSGITIALAKTPEDYQRLYGFVERAKQAGARIVVDPNVRAELWKEHLLPGEETPKKNKFSDHMAEVARTRIRNIMNLADCIYLSYPDDCRLFFGEQTPDEFAPLLLQRHDLKQLVVKLGGEGSILYEYDEEKGVVKHEIPPAPLKEYVDPSGAGDTFMAGTELTLAHIMAMHPEADRSAAMRRALAVGSLAGAAVVAQSGAVLDERNVPGVEALKAGMRAARLGESAQKSPGIG